ncbi:unnamed protein product [Brassicogethes aeneus]|uniref:Ubiquitin-like modifier-activating enzyme ATG7 n=1 Tax=Brassicogethes aeneus TaxID=1431903 RepID=A0A9P0B420_BRAAE|nr:unnamed protein product [Brassicogethes aeneus]
MANNLTYVQLSSCVNPSFWNKLTELKLNVDKLDEASRNIWGYFTNLNKDCVNSILEVDSTSYNENFNDQKLYIPFHGKILNKNTIEQFKECNKTDLINLEGKTLLESIKNGEVIKDPSLLNVFSILCFADLKKYHYYYWFSFPVLKDVIIEKGEEIFLSNKFTTENIYKLYNDFSALTANQKSYFIVEYASDELKLHKLEDKLNYITFENHTQYYFAFYNISSNNIPGSQLRNYVALILHYCPFLEEETQNFIAFILSREGSKVTCKDSTVFELKLPKADHGQNWVGWEKNERDKMGPKLANMKNTLDPNKLADDAVDLNLKLMKWRIMPNIDLEIVKNSKCLLLGSGTLGCSVARTLLAWGVRIITFVDNSTVSFSNPVRQSLFTFQDSVDMKPKSKAAADNLKKIFPGVIATGHQLNIPMPGHSVGESMLEQVRENVKKLDNLIEENDIIFLLMDSRESRWLPTLLGSHHNKIVINAALGFDTYLVMRHGTFNENLTETHSTCPEGFRTISGNRLGCYFCNDITAPGNSMKDRTLDQQCTVTRPGVSQIAGALAVELAVSVLQHSQRNSAPAFYQITNKAAELGCEIENQCVLGLIPHTVRGFLSSFNQVLPATEKFKQCVACSTTVVEEYRKNGFEFLLQVFNSSKFLEDLTGLSEMFKETECVDVWDLSDDEDE